MCFCVLEARVGNRDKWEKLTSIQTLSRLFFNICVDCFLPLGRVFGLTAAMETGQNSGRKENKLKYMYYLMTDSMNTKDLTVYLLHDGSNYT